MDLTERTIDSREVFRGRIIRVRQDTVRLPNGKESSREVVEHPGGVGILAIDGEDRVVLVRQYRYAFERVLTEIPAGKRETGEEPFLTAQRELKEEIGAEAGRWTELGALIASPGCYGETLYLYMAEDLTFGETHPDEDEFLEVLRVPFEEAVRQCMDGTLTDAVGQTYNYLYWEGVSRTEYDFSQGFCVPGRDTAAFLEDTLATLGLNRREANEFIVYWLPHMEGNAYNLIAFQTSSYTDHARLTADPAPDTVLRVFMAWKPLDRSVELPPQTLAAPVRTGFTLVEWGGAEIS